MRTKKARITGLCVLLFMFALVGVQMVSAHECCTPPTETTYDCPDCGCVGTKTITHFHELTQHSHNPDLCGWRTTTQEGSFWCLGTSTETCTGMCPDI